MERNILHMDLDTFFVSVERLYDKSLNGKPVIVGGLGERGVVSSCSYEARKFGVRSGMPIKLAKQLCNQGIYLSGDFEAYSSFSGMVTDIIKQKAPLYEKASIDEFYLDLTGMDKYYGCMKWSDELKNIIYRETRLPISFALAPNKMLSKVATDDAKPNGKYFVQRGHEHEYLDPKSISRIPMVGDKTFKLLSSMGVKTVGVLRQMPYDMLGNLLGKNGQELWRRANAIDETPVVPYSEAKSMSSERTFQTDTTDVDFLKRMIRLLTSNLAYDLRSNNKLTTCISVKIRYSDFNTEIKQARVPLTSSTKILTEEALQLFESLFDRRMLVRLIGVRFTGLAGGNYQINLFNDTHEHIKLTQAIDKVKTKYGKHLLTTADLMDFGRK